MLRFRSQMFIKQPNIKLSLNACNGVIYAREQINTLQRK